MAYIDGIYTTSATVLKDLANALARANFIKEPKVREEVTVKAEGLTLYVETSRYAFGNVAGQDPNNASMHVPTFYDLDGTFRGDITNDAWDSEEPRKIILTAGVVEGDRILVEYDSFRDCEIVFPARREDDGEGGPAFSTYFEQVEDQVNRINENQRFIIKMTTSLDLKPMSNDEFNEDPEHDIRRAHVYFEFKKPKYVINHETMDYNSVKLDDEGNEDIFSMINNHHFFVRMIESVDDVTGEIDATSAISNWAKMAWSLDYKEEVSLEPTENPDPDDEGLGEGQATILPVDTVKSRLAPVELPKFCNAERMPLQFFVNTDNDKINLVIRGNDDIAVNDYLLSYGYFGKIQGFVNDDTGYSYANDHIGNFAMTVGSSNAPLEYPRELPPNEFDVDMNSVLMDIKAFDDSKLGIDGEIGTFLHKTTIKENLIEGPQAQAPNYLNFWAPNTRVNYRVVFVGDDFESFPSNVLSATMYKYLYTLDEEEMDVGTFTLDNERILDVNARTTEAEYKMEPKLHIKIPDEISSIVKKVKIYKSIVNHWETDDPFFGEEEAKIAQDNLSFIQADPLVPEDPADKFDRFYLLEEYELQAGDITNQEFVYSDIKGHELMIENDDYVETTRKVERFSDTGAIKNITFSDRFGIDSTATGVNDILMFKTRVGSYFQKHYPAFMTPDEMLNVQGSGISRWTDRIHLTPVYVIHPNDGYRGELMDVLFINNKNMKNGDILIINEGKPDEKKYKFFKVNAPFSCLNASPNFSSGVAVRYYEYE
jgi:hypothetical protein